MKTSLRIAIIVSTLALSQLASAAVLLGPSVYPGNGHSYLIIDSARNWNATESEAVALGGHLAAISDAAENAFIAGMLDSLNLDWAWIGLNRASGASFEWVNGEPVTFTNWYPGEPNNASGSEFYGLTYGNAADNPVSGPRPRWKTE